MSKDYALSDVTRDGLDTAEVWGSNPHAPTNKINNLQREAATEGRFYDVSYDMAQRKALLLRRVTSVTNVADRESVGHKVNVRPSQPAYLAASHGRIEREDGLANFRQGDIVL